MERTIAKTGFKKPLYINEGYMPTNDGTVKRVSVEVWGDAAQEFLTFFKELFQTSTREGPDYLRVIVLMPHPASQDFKAIKPTTWMTENNPSVQAIWTFPDKDKQKKNALTITNMDYPAILSYYDSDRFYLHGQLASHPNLWGIAIGIPAQPPQNRFIPVNSPQKK